MAALLVPEARAQSADLVLCDRIAAHPADPDKPKDVQGVMQIAPSDIDTAIKFCRSASGSSRRAMYQLGRAYEAKRQMPDAVAAYRKAIEKGSTSAMVDLGTLYGTGNGVAKDPAEARKLFERASTAGNGRGMDNLTAVDGRLPSDPVEARAYLTKAADGNSREAQFKLGVMYAEGTGGPQNDAAARSLFEKAAAQDHPAALSWLGAFAQMGRGGPQDESAARKYYERGAALGSEDAKEALKRMDCRWAIKTKRGESLGSICF